MTRFVAAAPCARCPFRRDVPIYLRADRRREIVAGLIDGAGFPCHAEVLWTEDDDGADYVERVGAECAGAAKAMDLAGGSTQAARFAERLGENLDLSRGADVWPLGVWPLVPEGETVDTWDADDVEVATCSTVDPGCLAPAGYLGAGGAVVTGTVAADGECSMCGEPLCSNCADDDGRCAMCTEEEDEDL